MSAPADALDRIHRERMQAEGMPEIAIRAFLRAVRFVHDGGATTLPEASIEPVAALPRADELGDFAAAGREALGRAVVIKLNGGLGTSMGLAGPKSLLPVRDDATFLDLIARQILYLREREGVALPLLLMNSFRTRAASLARLERYDGIAGALPLDFLQHRVPRIDPETFAPVDWPDDPALAWCPPGHGDLYAAIASSGLLTQLRESGIRYAFVSNADNLGGVIDLPILGWFASEGLPFAMEVADRTAADRKGGHLARRAGRLILRESAQCAPEDVTTFQDIERHRYFNTNNLWLDLEALSEALAASPEGLPLPVMTNEKTIVADDPDSPRCVQLETAMGAAIECFEGAQALSVSRERFAPVKKTSDLLAVRSDAYALRDDARLVAVDAEATRRRVIELDDRFFKSVDHLDVRFPHGAPSLAEAEHLSIEGDHRFGRDVVIRGRVRLVAEPGAPVEIADGTILEG
ncbi:MAG: UTP--glucose-1-phosphate uridylyltransferase [Myxococcota bacterium]